MKKALIFQGGWVGHTPVETAALFKSILEENGFDVTVEDSLDCLNEYEPLLQYDLIVPQWTMGQISDIQQINVCKAVENGVGLAGCHGGMCDAFREATRWQFMTGAQFIDHPGGENTEYMVNLVPDTEFTRGLKDFKVKSEQYFLHYDPCVKVYATTTFRTEGPHLANGNITIPVVFTKMWGKGKVFYNSLGHTDRIFEEIPEAKELMTRGFLWAAR